MKRTIYIIFLGGLLGTSLSFGQNINPVAFDLASPIDVNLDSEGTAWVTQSGSGMNDGLVQKVFPDGSKETIIEGLPSFFDTMSNELQGALSTLILDDGRIFVCQGGGPDPLSASILEFHWDDYVAKNAPLVPADRQSAILVGEWALANGFMESNPYSFVLNADGHFIISDAAANTIFKYIPGTGTFEVVTTFPPFDNPTPVGPPVVEVVPTKILAHPSGGWLVSALTGFPFLDEAASIFHVQPDGSMTTYASGLTLLTDMAFDPNDGDLVALQFGRVDGTFNFQFGSAQLIKIQDTGTLDTLASDFGPSPGMAIADDGSVYMTHLFLGQLLLLDPISSGVNEYENGKAQSLSVYPNPGSGQLHSTTNFQEPGMTAYYLTDCLGRIIEGGTLGHMPKGENRLYFDFAKAGVVAGWYHLTIYTDQEIAVAKIVIR